MTAGIGVDGMDLIPCIDLGLHDLFCPLLVLGCCAPYLFIVLPMTLGYQVTLIDLYVCYMACLSHQS